MQDYYRLLGVSRLATPSEIKRAYQQLATRRAPATDPAAQEQWQAVQSGYELLRDPARRPAYDARLAQQPDTRSGAMRARDARRAQAARVAHGFRWVVC